MTACCCNFKCTLSALLTFNIAEVDIIFILRFFNQFIFNRFNYFFTRYVSQNIFYMAYRQNINPVNHAALARILKRDKNSFDTLLFRFNNHWQNTACPPDFTVKRKFAYKSAIIDIAFDLTARFKYRYKNRQIVHCTLFFNIGRRNINRYS